MTCTRGEGACQQCQQAVERLRHRFNYGLQTGEWGPFDQTRQWLEEHYRQQTEEENNERDSRQPAQ